MTQDVESAKVVFSKTVEQTANEGEIGVLEACIAVASEFGVDIEDIPKLLTDRVKEQIEHESRMANLIHRGAPKQTSLDSFFSE